MQNRKHHLPVMTTKPTAPVDSLDDGRWGDDISTEALFFFWSSIEALYQVKYQITVTHAVCPNELD